MTSAGAPSAPSDAAPGASQATFVHELDDAFARAIAGTRERAMTLGVAGQTVRIVFAGDTLVPFVRGALAPRISSGGTEAPDLTVKLWDTATTGVSAPLPPGAPFVYGARGEVPGYTTEPVFAACSHASGALSVLDVVTSTAYFWVRDPGDLALHELGAPLLSLFGWFFRARDAQLVHAAAVGRAGQAVLLAGPGGSGKSTTALACLAAGLTHIADDYALVVGAPRPVVHALYATAKLNADSLARLPHLARVVRNPEREPEEKALLDLGPNLETRPGNAGAISALVFPRVGAAGAPALIPIAAGEALRALAPSTIFQMAGAGASTFAILGTLVKAVPAFRLQLGPDLSAVAASVASLLPPT
jgi:hypothetical protein